MGISVPSELILRDWCHYVQRGSALHYPVRPSVSTLEVHDKSIKGLTPGDWARLFRFQDLFKSIAASRPLPSEPALLILNVCQVNLGTVNVDND